MANAFFLALIVLAALAPRGFAAQPGTAPARQPVERRVIEIATARAALTLAVGDDGRLYQLGFGAAERRPAAPRRLPRQFYDRSGDRQAESYPPAGNGFLSEPALQAVHADGNTSTDLVYVRHTVRMTDDPNVTVTRVELKDPQYPFTVTLCFRAYRAQDVIEQWTEIRNNERGTVTLHRFASSSPVLRAREYWLTQLHGYHMREADLIEERLTPGVKTLDSKLGVRAHQMRPPSFVLALDGRAREEEGEAFGGSLAWAGSYELAFDLDWNNGLRVVAGIQPLGAQRRLKPGETFATPAMIWTWSDRGKGQVSRNLHRWARRYGLRDGDKPRPVLLNNWEATYFNFDEAKLVSLLDGARDIGAELFLLDDGWFGNKYPRNDDRQGLGDWQVNKRKLPRGLPYLVEQAKRRDLGFGIWLEPEMVNPRSELFERHPDWAMTQPGREPILGRSQRALDLSRPAVREFVWNTIDGTLRSAPGIRYVKWDSNAYALQPGSTFLKPEEQTHLLVDYQHALYDIMRRTAERHPDVMMMLCSSGPARLDYGSLRHFHSFWASDNTDPARRVFIQWGFGHIFPAQAISAHVTEMGHRPLKFAIDVALSGAFGIDRDVSKLSEEEKRLLRSAVTLYKDRLREVVAQGDLYRLDSPYENPRSAIGYVTEDQSRAVLFVYQIRNADASGAIPPVRVREVNLPEGATSKLAPDNPVIDGSTLMRDGLVPPCAREFDSAVIELAAE